MRISQTNLSERMSGQLTSINLKENEIIKQIVARIATNFPKTFKDALPSEETATAKAKFALESIMLNQLKQINKILTDEAKRTIDAAVKSFIDSSVRSNVLDMLSTDNVYSGPLPDYCYSYRRVGTSEKFIIQQPPMVKRVNINSSLAQHFGDKDGIYDLGFPYVVFIVSLDRGRFSDMQVWMRNSKLSVDDDTLYYPLFSNIWTDKSGDSRSKYCSVCRGSDFNITKSRSNEIVDQAIDLFWAGQFNSDLADRFVNSLSKTSIISFSDWASKSKSNSLFIMREKLISYDPLSKYDKIGARSEADQKAALEQLKKNLRDNTQPLMDDMEILFTKASRMQIPDNLRNGFNDAYITMLKNYYDLAEQAAKQLTDAEILKDVSFSEIVKIINEQIPVAFAELIAGYNQTK
jgi:hypothetical protein